jgi:hypothetical protein
MAFVFSKSTPLTGYVAMYEFKELLKSAGWVVKSSGTGTSGAGSGVYDAAADAVTTSELMSNPKAWFRIQSPDTLREYTFQTVSVATDWRVKYSFAAKFIGGAPAAGITPSATDEYIIWGTGTDAAPSANTFFTTNNTYRWNVCADNASPYGFWAGAFRVGIVNTTTQMLIDEPLTATHPSDAHTHLIIMNNVGMTRNYLYLDALSASTCINISTIPSAAPTTVVHYPAASLQSVSHTLFPNGMTTNPIDGKDEICPITYSRRSALANSSWKGIGTLMKWTGIPRSIGSTLSVLSTSDRMIYGDVSFPWDGTTPSI